jgi:hypothetical protein
LLQGGYGVDVYKFELGFGQDQVIDADGKGRIEVAGLGVLSGDNTERMRDKVWRGKDGQPKNGSWTRPSGL